MVRVWYEDKFVAEYKSGCCVLLFELKRFIVHFSQFVNYIIVVVTNCLISQLHHRCLISQRIKENMTSQKNIWHGDIAVLKKNRTVQD